MHHMDVPMDYHVWNTIYAGTLSKKHDKAGQRNAEKKDCFVDNAEWFASRVHW